MLDGMAKVSKWTAGVAYVAIWAVLGLLAVVFAGNWTVILLPLIWAWTIFNLVQVWRGKRQRLWR
jgi:hypothetical protein